MRGRGSCLTQDGDVADGMPLLMKRPLTENGGEKNLGRTGGVWALRGAHPQPIHAAHALVVLGTSRRIPCVFFVGTVRGSAFCEASMGPGGCVTNMGAGDCDSAGASKEGAVVTRAQGG